MNPHRLLPYLAMLFALLFIIGCEKDDLPTTPRNRAPVIESLTSSPVSSQTNRISNWTLVILKVIVTDQNYDALHYYWSSAKGFFVIDNTSVSAVWQPPQILINEDDTIYVTVDDGVATATMSIAIFLTCQQPPTLLSPPNSSIVQSTSQTFSWSVCSYASGYTLQVSTDSSFTSFIYNDSGLTTTNKRVSGLSNDSTYFWRVKAKKGNISTEWPAACVFKIHDPCYGNTSVAYLGKTYQTVGIRNQCWLKENLDVDPKRCYDDKSVNCDTYGGLYTWGQAIGICPSGWHLPTIAEFDTLIRNTPDENSVIAAGQGTGDGAGTNTSGFSAMLGGFYTPMFGGVYAAVGHETYFWSSTTADGDYSAWRMRLTDHNAGLTKYYDRTDNRYSVRCIKD